MVEQISETRDTASSAGNVVFGSETVQTLMSSADVKSFGIQEYNGRGMTCRAGFALAGHDSVIK